MEHKPKKKPNENEMATKPKRNHETYGKLGILANFTIECPTINVGLQEKKQKADYNCQRLKIIKRQCFNV